MLKGENIVRVASGQWNHLWYRRQAMSCELAKHNRVLYIEPPLPLWRKNNGRLNLVDKLTNFRLREVKPNVFVFSPLIFLPFSRFKAVDYMNRFLLSLTMKLILRRLGFMQTILILDFVREAEWFIGQCGEKIIIYDCTDNYPEELANSSEKRKQLLVEMERRIIERVDMIFAVNEPLLEKRKKENKNTFLLPNAVDVEQFSSRNLDVAQMPEDLKGIPRPIIGYTGTIQKLFTDFGLLGYVTSHKPEWSIVVVGPLVGYDPDFLRNQLLELRREKNIYFLGQRSFDLLPGYIMAFDVCIFPYVRNEFTDRMSSLKVFQYLAAGKPVVSSVPLSKVFENTAYVANDREEFILLVAQCLEEANNENLVRRRMDVASKNSWEDRVKEMGRLINEYLGGARQGM